MAMLISMTVFFIGGVLGTSMLNLGYMLGFWFCVELCLSSELRMMLSPRLAELLFGWGEIGMLDELQQIRRWDRLSLHQDFCCSGSLLLET
jgi:hypothetical protein